MDLDLGDRELDMRRSIAAWVGLLLASVSLAEAPPALASRELIRNPTLMQSRNGEAVGWKSEAYDAKEGATLFEWEASPSRFGVLSIDSRRENDARYVQNVAVSPGTWYRITGWGRTEEVGTARMGLYLAVMGTFHNSRDLRGTMAWQPLDLWVKTDSLTTKLPIACRLGGYASLNTGKGWCTGISVVAAGTPEPDAEFVYGNADGPSLFGGSDLGIQVISLLVAAGFALLLWRYLLPYSRQIPE